jgi:hypothetical protein
VFTVSSINYFLINFSDQTTHTSTKCETITPHLIYRQNDNANTKTDLDREKLITQRLEPYPQQQFSHTSAETNFHKVTLCAKVIMWNSIDTFYFLTVLMAVPALRCVANVLTKSNATSNFISAPQTPEERGLSAAV